MTRDKHPARRACFGKSTVKLGFVVALLLCATYQTAAEAKSNLTDAQVKQQIIQESIQSYHGSCPCPYNVAKNGSRCGKRSAYSRPGGAAPICYESDVTEPMLRDWRKRHGE